MKLRLIITLDCNRGCEGCCNQDWDIKNLPFESDFTKYDEILLTGGEPMLRPDLLESIIEQIKQQTDVPIYLYTAKIDDAFRVLKILEIIDGITITLHEWADGIYFRQFKNFLPVYMEEKSLRLNVFKGADDYGPFFNAPWVIKDDIGWVKDCPLPEGEVLMRYQDPRVSPIPTNQTPTNF
jgi:hypothetical protein